MAAISRLIRRLIKNDLLIVSSYTIILKVACLIQGWFECLNGKSSLLVSTHVIPKAFGTRILLPWVLNRARHERLPSADRIKSEMLL